MIHVCPLSTKPCQLFFHPFKNTRALRILKLNILRESKHTWSSDTCSQYK